ncbi:hypothetical protein [Serinicoccus sp. CNJ-927]|uniref:hypothetical protein n=1 Tax=Serinicoccus sp. CNJ-927 TaxID=1904970 RepID=UPI0013015480|nr:hypothetical protein [Serinicoccus sp. CNJ-927]
MSESDPGSERDLLDQTRQQLVGTLEDLGKLQEALERLPQAAPDVVDQTDGTVR